MRFVVFSLLVVASLAERVRYDGYQTLRIEPKDEYQQSVIHRLAETHEDKLDFWVPAFNKRTDVMVAPWHQAWLKNLLAEVGIEYSIMIEDVQALIDAETDMDKASATYSYDQYNSYEQINAWMDDMALSRSLDVEKFRIATSGEGRPIYALKISKGGTGKKVVYWQGGIHAREWISPATVMYMTKELVDNSPACLDELDFIIVPLLNADGYEYSRDNDRMWRKTRSTYSGTQAVGVDANRNYPYEWGGNGASDRPTSSTYRGPYALSEPELQGSTEYLQALGNVAVFIDFHSYSQLWLSPWSYSKLATLPSDFDSHQAAGEVGSEALAKRYGTSYTVGPSARELYAASGVSVDWAYGTLKAKYACTIELRDKGRYGFLLPESQIIESGLETFDGVMAYIDYAVNN